MRRYTSVIFVVLWAIVLFLEPEQATAGRKVYRLGVPMNPPQQTFDRLLAGIENRLAAGEEIEVVHVDLTGFETPAGQERIRQEIESKCDLFFVCGNQLGVVYDVKINSPLLFISLATDERPIPESMQANTTGVYRGTRQDTVKQSLMMLPKEQRHKLALIYSTNSSLSHHVSSNLRENFRDLDVELLPREYNRRDNIARIMKEVKEEGAQAVILFPPAVPMEDLPEIISWQHKLGLPVIGQTKEQIAMGLVGGPTINRAAAVSTLADYAVKIFRGRSPAVLPIKYYSPQYIINLTSVSKLGLMVPEEITRQAEIVGVYQKKKNRHTVSTKMKPGMYSIGIAKSTAKVMLRHLQGKLAERGYLEGENLSFVFFDVQEGRITNREQLAHCDLLFSIGSILPALIEDEELNIPVCYLSSKETASLIPAEKQGNFTGVVRTSIASVFNTSKEMVAGAEKMAILAHDSSRLRNSMDRYQRIGQSMGETINFRFFSSTDEIGPLMRELKRNSDCVLLFPPALSPADINEIVRWQNKLKLPVVAQVKNHVEAGLLGGAVMDSEKLSEKLAEYMDKLLSGRQPAQLPLFYIAEKYVINLKTVNILKLEIPVEVIAKAEVIY